MALIWVALMLLMILGFVALSIDAGYLYALKNRTQVTADASALAAAAMLPDPDAARLEAVAYAGRNMSSARHGVVLEGADVIVGSWSQDERVFTPGGVPADAARVTIRRSETNANPVTLIFATALGIDEMDVESSATAWAQGAPGAAILVLDETAECAMHMDSNAEVTVTGGSIQVNSSDSSAFCADSNALVNGTPLNVTGEGVFRGNASYTGSYNPGAPTVEDPLIDLEAPQIGLDMGAITLESNQVGVAGPGYYSGGISLDSNTRLVLDPGIYVLDGVGLRIHSHADLIAEGVLFYIIDSTPGSGDASAVDIDSNGEIVITPMEDGPWAGVSIFQARDNDNLSIINSNGDLTLEGTLYMPENELEIDSNGDLVGNQIIVDRLHMDSNARIFVDYDNRNPTDYLLRLVE